MCKQLAQGCTRQRGGQDSNPRPADSKSGSLSTQLGSRTCDFVAKNILRLKIFSAMTLVMPQERRPACENIVL